MSRLSSLFPRFQHFKKKSELQKAQIMANVNFAQKRKISQHYREEAVGEIYFSVSKLKQDDSFPKKLIVKKLRVSVKVCFPRQDRKISKTSYDRCYLRDKIW